jgi:protein-disulfide isomerase
MHPVRLKLALAAAVAAGLLASPLHAAPAPPAKPAGPAASLPPKFTADEYVMGDPSAKVSVTEYASVACPHCAKFDAQVFPALKAKYIDTGKVRFALREMLVGDQGMVQVAAAGFMLARCAGQDRYFQVVEAMYRAQPEIFNTGDLKGVLTRIAKDNGLSEPQMEACVSDQAGLDALNARVKLADADHVQGTPTFLVNGRKLDEHGKEPDLALFDAALQPLVAAAPAHKARHPR